MKFICIGRNYKKHIAELNNTIPKQPLVFIKNSDTLCATSQVAHPTNIGDIHYECEFVVRFSKDIAINTYISNLSDIIKECSLGIDFTARDLQDSLKQKGHPWELAKSFENSTLIGEWVPFDEKQYSSYHFTLENAEAAILQEGNLSQLIFPIDRLINFILSYMSIRKGDVLFTGTPSGVGSCTSGTSYRGKLGSKKVLEFSTL